MTFNQIPFYELYTRNKQRERYTQIHNQRAARGVNPVWF